LKTRNIVCASAFTFGLASFFGAAPAHAQLAVFDASSFAELVSSLQTGEAQLAQLQEQLTTQLAMIRSIPSDIMTDTGISTLAGATQGLMQQITLLENDGNNIQSTLSSLYPTNWGNLTTVQGVINQLASMQTQTRSAYQSSLALESQVAANGPLITAGVRAADSASMGATGPTAAEQAGNSILGMISQQLGDEQSLLIAASQAEQQRELQEQAQDAAAAQAETDLWSSPDAATTTITDSALAGQ
jgi:P-type conjugative transfer protein TrbJ